MAPRARRRVLTWPTLLILAVGGVVALLIMLRPEPPLAVETVVVRQGEVRELVPAAAAGIVEPARRVSVRAELAGTITEVHKNPGDRVETGELVVLFRSDELDARVAQARANVDASKVLVEVAKDRHALTARTLERSQKLAKRGALSSAELERVEAEVRAAKLGVDKADSTVDQARAAERLARVARARASVTAPFGGVLQDVTAELGTQVAPGTALFDLIDDTGVSVEIPVDEADVPKISVGQTVLIRVSGRRADPIRGQVTFIPPALGRSGSGSPLGGASLAARDRALYVRVTPTASSGLRVGAAVDAEFLVQAHPDVLWIPTHVVIGRGITREVYRVRDGRAERVTFEPGLTSWERTEVVGGLNAGDQIVSSLDVKGLEDRTRVVVSNQPTTDAARAESPAP